MTTADVLAVLEALGGLRVWVDGGWGVDALLGEQTRAHGDLDLAVDEAQLGEAELRLAYLGYVEDDDACPGRPTRVVLADGRGRVVDLHPLAFDAAGVDPSGVCALRGAKPGTFGSAPGADAELGTDADDPDGHGMP